LSDEQSQARLSYAMTMSKSRKSKFMCKPNAEPSLLNHCHDAAIKLENRNYAKL